MGKTIAEGRYGTVRPVTGTHHFFISAAKLLIVSAVIMALSIFIWGYTSSALTGCFDIEAAEGDVEQTAEMRIMNAFGAENATEEALLNEAPIQWTGILSAGMDNGYVKRDTDDGRHLYVMDGTCEDGTAMSRFILRDGYGKVTVGRSICDDDGNVYGVNKVRSGGYVKTTYYFASADGTYSTSKYPSIFSEVPEPVWHDGAPQVAG